ncbi:unnamed protein product [Cylicocyclus nassatus]|uniref:ShKT domain-containing protein n=1 Tax=Cylicocyclus nassatus TaxID=53992 RepID=A0AA36M9P3_CYLNA|nr:unnamed protein product [Cylicocyclus nassatus]
MLALLGCTQAAQRRNSNVNEKIIGAKNIVKRQVEIACGKNEHCATWQKKGFCENTFYSLEFRKKWCGVPCGLCESDENDI